MIRDEDDGNKKQNRSNENKDSQNNQEDEKKNETNSNKTITNDKTITNNYISNSVSQLCNPDKNQNSSYNKKKYKLFC